MVIHIMYITDDTCNDVSILQRVCTVAHSHTMYLFYNEIFVIVNILFTTLM